MITGRNERVKNDRARGIIRGREGGREGIYDLIEIRLDGGVLLGKLEALVLHQLHELPLRLVKLGNLGGQPLNLAILLHLQTKNGSVGEPQIRKQEEEEGGESRATGRGWGRRGEREEGGWITHWRWRWCF